jgi:hypothetical protein
MKTTRARIFKAGDRVGASITAPVAAKGRFWTLQELQVIRERYPEEGAPGCKALLPDRTIQGIQGQAYAMGIRYRNRPERHAPHASSEWIDAQITRLFERGTIPRRGVADLAERLQRPRWWVSKRAANLGLVVPRTKEPDWSAEELALLETHASNPPAVVARIFKRHGFARSATGIKVKRVRLGLSVEDPDILTARELARLMRVDEKKVARWIASGLLAAKRRGTDRVESQGGDYWAIPRKAIRDFFIRCPGEWDHRRVDQLFLIDILAGTVGAREAAA